MYFFENPKSAENEDVLLGEFLTRYDPRVGVYF
jgi:hypothetical protein